MKNIVCCLEQHESFVRITNYFRQYNNSFGDYIKDLKHIQRLSTNNKWDYAVVDKNLSWLKDAVNFFNKISVPIIYFDDDYSAVIKEIDSLISKDIEVADEALPQNNMRVENKVKIINKVVTKNKIVYTGIDNTNVLIANFNKCAGATTITLCLAEYISKELGILTSIIEPPIDKPTIFHWMGIKDRLFEASGNNSNGFYSYPHEIFNNNPIKSNMEYSFDNKTFLVPDYQKEPITEWNYDQMIKLINASNLCPINLIDVGSNIEHEAVAGLLPSIDVILVIVDPFITNCVRDNSRLEHILELKNNGYPIHFVVNKWNKAVDDKAFKNYLTCKPLARIPAIDLNLLYRSNFNANIPNSNNDIAEIINGPLNNISSIFINREFFKIDSGKDNNISASDKFSNILKKIKFLRKG